MPTIIIGKPRLVSKIPGLVIKILNEKRLRANKKIIQIIIMWKITSLSELTPY